MSILDRIVKASEAKQDFMKILIHGQSGTGKSTMCATAPGRILYLWTERQGVLSFKRLRPGDDTLQIESLENLREALDYLRGGNHKYDTACLDSLTDMQRLIVGEITAGKDAPTIADWGTIINRTLSLVEAYRNLPMHVVITALSDEAIIGEEQRIVRPSVAGRKLPGQLSQFFNIVGYCFKRAEKDRVKYTVLLDGRDDFSCKGMPGLRYREEPDISHWYDVAILGKPSRATSEEGIIPATSPHQQEPVTDNAKPQSEKSARDPQSESSKKPDPEPTDEMTEVSPT